VCFCNIDGRYNFASKGGYHWPRVWEGEEDYRWPVLRAKIPAFQNKQVWRLFHLLFIALYQNILLWVITVPAVAAWSALPLNRYDLLAAAAMLLFIFVETKADKQQVWGLGFGVWGLGFRVWGLGFGVWG